GHRDRRAVARAQRRDHLLRDLDPGRGLAAQLYGRAEFHAVEYAPVLGLDRGEDRRGERARRLERREVTGTVSQASSAVAKNSPIRSDHARGNSGSCSGHRTVVGTAIRSAGSGACSARVAATDPAPARYQAIEAANAPGGP